jgi:hypothetical protein
VTAVELLRACAARRITLWVDAQRLRYRAPTGVLTPELAMALGEGKTAVIELLRAQGNTVPPPACTTCATSAWLWAPDWPRAGDGCWLCGTCAAVPAPALAAVAATLTAEERARLGAEAAGGDRLALLVLAHVMLVRCESCGGAGWHPIAGIAGERCADCHAWSPCSSLRPEATATREAVTSPSPGNGTV